MGSRKKLSDQEMLEVIALSPDPVVTARELADKTEYGADGVRVRLKELESAGLVASRDVGARAKVWWLTPDGRSRLS